MDNLNRLNKDCVELLQRNKLFIPLIKSEFIRQLLSKVEIDNKIENQTICDFKNRLGVKTEDELKQFLIKNNISKEEFLDLALYDLRCKQYSFANFGNKIESHYLERKHFLDVVVYSLIRVSDQFRAREFFQRIVEKEEDMGDLAAKYSEGLEKKTRGIIGPIPLNQGHPELVKVLTNSKIGQIHAPRLVENSFLIIRLESYDAAKLDDYMREKMAIELFNQWVETEVNSIHTNLCKQHALNFENGKES